MQPFDLTPFYRNSIGVDKLMETLQSHVNANNSSYPPYNIISVDDDSYIIEIAIAGFREDEVNITTVDGQLIVRGEHTGENTQIYLHSGICAKKFKRSFSLAEYVEVQCADLHNGILSIELKRIVPDSKKPREIQIGGIEI